MNSPTVLSISRSAAALTCLAVTGLWTGCASAPPDAPASAGEATVAAQPATVGPDFEYSASVPAPPPGATPVEVWELQQRKMRSMADWFDRVDTQVGEFGDQDLSDAEMEAIMADLDAEAQRVFTAESLAPYVTDAALQELESWESLSWKDRMGRYVMVVSTMVPTEYEVLDQQLEDDTATLEVRGYFEQPMFSEPGWNTGTIRLLRERGEWRVEKEEWGDG